MGYPHWDGAEAADCYSDSAAPGTPLRCQLGGKGEGFGIVTPLSYIPEVSVAAEAGWQLVLEEQYGTLCMEGTGSAPGALGQTMFEYVLRASDGNSYGFSHVQQTPAKFGVVHPGDVLCHEGQSGIVGLCGAACSGCGPWHTHLRAWRGHGPGPTNGGGDLPVEAAVRALGWTVLEVRPCVSPQMYQQCRAQRGKPI